MKLTPDLDAVDFIVSDALEHRAGEGVIGDGRCFVADLDDSWRDHVSSKAVLF